MKLEDFLKEHNYSDTEIQNLQKVFNGDSMPEDFNAKALIEAKNQFNKTKWEDTERDRILTEEKKKLSIELMGSIYSPINSTLSKVIDLGAYDQQSYDSMKTTERLKKLVEYVGELKSKVDNSGKGDDEKIKLINDELKSVQSTVTELKAQLVQKDVELETKLKEKDQQILIEKERDFISKQMGLRAADKEKFGWADEVKPKVIILATKAHAAERGIEMHRNEDGVLVLKKKNGVGFPYNLEGTDILETIDQLFDEVGKEYNFIAKRAGDKTHLGVHEMLLGDKKINMSSVQALKASFEKR